MTDLGRRLLQAAREAKEIARIADAEKRRSLSHQEEKLAKMAKRRLIAEERARDAEERIAHEAKRQVANAAKIAQLRELRLAKEAAEPKAKTKVKPGKRK